MRRSSPLTRTLSPVPALGLAAVLALSGCGDSTASAGDADRLDVAVGFYPYEFVAQRVGGDDVQVTNLTEPGGEPHDLELSPRQVAEVSQADLVVYSAGFQPAVDDAVEQHADGRALDVLTAVELREGAGHAEDEHAVEQAGEEHADDEHAGEQAGEEHADDEHAGEQAGDEHGEAGADPHVWLDPQRLSTIATAVAERMAELEPDNADGFRTRARELGDQLSELDEQMRAGLASCARTQIVTSHDAFGYLADAYGLEQVAIAGLSPDAEASLQRLAEIAEQAKVDGVTTVFFEELVSPKVAQSLAREVGAEATVLSPLEGPPAEGDYLSAMRTNLSALRKALDCR